jgi:Ca2+/Na+ antiporter
LIFSPIDLCFDRNTKIYTAILLTVTSLFAAYVLLSMPLGRIGGVLLALIFLIYIASITFAIYKEIVAPPEDDDDSDSEGDMDSDSESGIYTALEAEKSGLRHSRSNSNTGISLQDIEAAGSISPKSTPLAQESFNSVDLTEALIQFPTKPGKTQHSTTYHTCYLIFAVLTLSLSGYLLSHSIITLSNAFSISNSLLGITLLSFATTLPEKIVAILSGARSQSGVLVANTAGSNIFLLTLCAGVLFLAGDLESLQVNGVSTFEILWMWGSSVLFFATVMMGGKRWMGWGLLAMYLAFIVCEFTLEMR